MKNTISINRMAIVYYILPTKYASNLAIAPSGKLDYNSTTLISKLGWDNHYIYLTSDAPVPDVQYTRVFSNISVYRGKYYLHNESKVIGEILFTTDPKLIADGVPAIDGNTKASFVCPICEGVGFTIKGYTMDCENCKGKKNIEVNFLTEFCKRWNEKDNKQCKEFEAHKFAMENFNICPYCKKGNQKVVTREKAETIATRTFSRATKEWRDEVERLQKVDARATVDDIMVKHGLTIDSYDKESLEDMERAINQALQSQSGGFSLENMWELYKITCKDFDSGAHRDTFNKFIQSLQPQSKGDIVIECEMEEHLVNKNGNEPRNADDVKGSIYKIKLKDGQPIFYFK